MQTTNLQNETDPKKIKLELKVGDDLKRIYRLINGEAKKLADSLEINPELLQEWLSCYSKVPSKIIIDLLCLANLYRLNPLNNEITFSIYEDQQWQAMITVDGIFKLLNREPTFCGIALVESEEKKEGIPIWMECTIHRSDRIVPIIIREYFDEIKSNNESWNKIPRRMLRHRTIQQCVRVAFGIYSSTKMNAFNSKSLTIKLKHRQNEVTGITALREALLIKQGK
jgi:hypothetical protein